MSITSVAILGLGTMGSGMAQNLLKAGFSLAVYNRTISKAERLGAQGARVAASAADAVRGAQVIISMLADDEASRSVWMGNGKSGALSATETGAVLIESSTVSPAWIADLGAAATTLGHTLLDAPVTGSRAQAESGQLTFLVGGSEEALAVVTPALEAMGKQIIHFGGLGSGAKMKLVNNFLCGVQVASLAEGIAWLERSGLDHDKALKFLNKAAPASPLFQTISARMSHHDYEVNFLLKLMSKDLRYAQDEAKGVSVHLSTAANARALFEHAIDQGYSDQDMSAVIEPLRKLNALMDSGNHA